ncbi:MAG: hypothetical protein KDB50_06085 [Mycobacterium sp.]|nr:hypothetical protein [Mycobacterium sp.]
MGTLEATLRRTARAVAAVTTIGAGLLAAPDASADTDATPAAPCYNGIAPLNPYVDNCALPSRPPHILGAAPDQTAILNCSVGSGVWRAICLSQYVNGGNYGLYPGFGVGSGSRP